MQSRPKTQTTHKPQGQLMHDKHSDTLVTSCDTTAVLLQHNAPHQFTLITHTLFHHSL